MSYAFTVAPAATVIPAKAGIHIGEPFGSTSPVRTMDSRLRGNDEVML